ncbi:MAG: FHA domain-containing protein [Prosthecobacter sp.]|jgi:hypothetical protein|uniref:FHA domain-containing protein n=1 Tax=Prosthecobacter sp. TaxID=1965333 RepID=UPI0019EE0FC4|nr:FHA domain-containing protein [Prosthecobacter sp.]MBE2282464.1 FHA domain-containing protein [Prosthecobacter sp.]
MNLISNTDSLPDDKDVAAVASTVFQPSPDLSRLRARMAVAASMLRRLPVTPHEPALLFAMGESEPLYSVSLEEAITVGRGEDCQVVISSGSSLSRRHFRIDKVNDDFELTDLGSTNGTRVNEDESLIDSHLLRDGDLIHAGDITFLFFKGGE